MLDNWAIGKEHEGRTQKQGVERPRCPVARTILSFSCVKQAGLYKFWEPVLKENLKLGKQQDFLPGILYPVILTGALPPSPHCLRACQRPLRISQGQASVQGMRLTLSLRVPA